MNTSRGKCAGVAAILLLLVSGYANAEVTEKTVLEQQSPSVVMDSSGDYVGLSIINLDEMSVMRGGFSIAGMDLTFGATLRTLIDNIKLETVFNITTAGAEIVSQVLSDISGLNEAMATVSQQVAANNDVSASTVGSTAVLVGPATGTSVTDVAPDDINLDGLSSGFSGVVITNNKGFTAALHSLTQKAAKIVTLSNASDLKVNTKLDITIRIANKQAVLSAAKAAALSRWADSFRR